MNTIKFKNVILSVIIMTLFAAQAVSVFAQGCAKEKDHDKGARMQKLYKELNLSDEQKKLLDANREKNRSEMKSLFDEIKTKRDLIRQELQNEQLDMDKINKLNNELKEAQNKLLDNKLQSILEVRSILTPQQFKEFSSKIEEKRGHFKDKRKHHKEEACE